MNSIDGHSTNAIANPLKMKHKYILHSNIMRFWRPSEPSHPIHQTNKQRHISIHKPREPNNEPPPVLAPSTFIPRRKTLPTSIPNQLTHHPPSQTPLPQLPLTTPPPKPQINHPIRPHPPTPRTPPIHNPNLRVHINSLARPTSRPQRITDRKRILRIEFEMGRTREGCCGGLFC